MKLFEWRNHQLFFCFRIIASIGEIVTHIVVNKVVAFKESDVGTPLYHEIYRTWVSWIQQFARIPRPFRISLCIKGTLIIGDVSRHEVLTWSEKSGEFSENGLK